MVFRVRHAISALVIVQGTIVVALIKSKVDHHHEKKKRKSRLRERPRHRDSVGMLATVY